MAIVETVIGGITVAAISGIAGFILRSKSISQLPSQIISNSLLIDNQDDLYRKLIDQIKSGKIHPKEIIFIQHSGYVVSQTICWLLEHGIKVTLYQQDPDSPVISDSDSLKRRIQGVPDDIAIKEGNTKFSGKLTIKRFRTPASLRAVLIDKDVLVVSWYVYWLDLDNNRLKIRGSENEGIFVTKQSTKFEALYNMVDETRISLDRECQSGSLVHLSRYIDLYGN